MNGPKRQTTEFTLRERGEQTLRARVSLTPQPRPTHTYSKPIDFIAGGEYWFLPSKIGGVFKSSFILGKNARSVNNSKASAPSDASSFSSMYSIKPLHSDKCARAFSAATGS